MKVVLLKDKRKGFPDYITNNLDVEGLSRKDPLLVFSAEMYLSFCEKNGITSQNIRVEELNSLEDGYVVLLNESFYEIATPFSTLNVIMCPTYGVCYE